MPSLRRTPPSPAEKWWFRRTDDVKSDVPRLYGDHILAQLKHSGWRVVIDSPRLHIASIMIDGQQVFAIMWKP